MNDFILLLYFLFSVFFVGACFLRLFKFNFYNKQMLMFCMSLGIGCLIYTYFLFFLLLFSIDKNHYLYFDLLLSIICFFWFISSKNINAYSKQNKTKQIKLEMFLAIMVIALSLYLLIPSMLNVPLGAGDPITNWNLKANFIFNGWDGLWKNMYSDFYPKWTHPDYPLFFPLLTARAMFFGMEEIYLYQISTHLMFYFLSCITISSVLLYYYDAKIALSLLLILTSVPYVYDFLPIQHSDVFFLYFLSVSFSLLLIYLKKAEPNASTIMLIILFSCSSAWVKNEGYALAISMMTLLTFLLFLKSQFKKIFLIFLTSSLFLFIPIIYNISFVSSENDLISSFGIIDLHVLRERIKFLPELAINILWNSGFGSGFFLISTCYIFFIFISNKEKQTVLLLFTPFVFLCLAYYIVLLFIPLDYDYSWFITHSVSRLAFQLYGIFGLIGFVILGEYFSNNKSRKCNEKH